VCGERVNSLCKQPDQGTKVLLGVAKAPNLVTYDQCLNMVVKVRAAQSCNMGMQGKDLKV